MSDDKMDALVERLALLRYNQIWQLDDESWPEEAASNEREACRSEALETIAALTIDDLRYLIEREGKWKVVPLVPLGLTLVDGQGDIVIDNTNALQEEPTNG